MDRNSDLYHLLFDKSEKEREIEEKIDKCKEEYENSDAYKNHENKMNELWKELSDAYKERRDSRKEEIKKKRDRGNHVETKEVITEIRNRQEEKYNALPQDIKDLIEKYKNLSERERKMFAAFSQDKVFYDDDEKKPYPNPVTTEKDIDELHSILVQTVLNFMEDRNLTDIDEVSFSADSLQTSLQYHEWTPATDSYLGLIGLIKENPEDEYSWVRRLIGKSM